MDKSKLGWVGRIGLPASGTRGLVVDVRVLRGKDYDGRRGGQVAGFEDNGERDHLDD